MSRPRRPARPSRPPVSPPMPPVPDPPTPEQLAERVIAFLEHLAKTGIKIRLDVHYHNDPAGDQAAIDRLTARAKASTSTLDDAVHAASPPPTGD